MNTNSSLREKQRWEVETNMVIDKTAVKRSAQRHKQTQTCGGRLNGKLFLDFLELLK